MRQATARPFRLEIPRRHCDRRPAGELNSVAEEQPAGGVAVPRRPTPVTLPPDPASRVCAVTSSASARACVASGSPKQRLVSRTNKLPRSHRRRLRQSRHHRSLLARRARRRRASPLRTRRTRRGRRLGRYTLPPSGASGASKQRPVSRTNRSRPRPGELLLQRRGPRLRLPERNRRRQPRQAARETGISPDSPNRSRRAGRATAGARRGPVRGGAQLRGGGAARGRRVRLAPPRRSGRPPGERAPRPTSVSVGPRGTFGSISRRGSPGGRLAITSGHAGRPHDPGDATAGSSTTTRPRPDRRQPSCG